MDQAYDYYIIIAASLTIIISYFFNIISKRTGIPSVLLLILLGIIAQYGIQHLGLKEVNLTPFLGVLGTAGLVLIVLEAALDLDISREKRGLIIRSLLSALLGILINAIPLGFIIQAIIGNMTFALGFMYAIPISIMSSAIIIPSVTQLPEKKKEFMIYEGTFSDILGIIIFYATVDNLYIESTHDMVWSISSNLLLTLVISTIASFAIFLLFNKIKGEVKLFLLIAILMLITTIGKVFHLSTLLLILIFGLMLKNRYLLPRFINRRIDGNRFNKIFENFNLITLESSFVLRTFFFVIFGFSITLSNILSMQVLTLSIAALILLYVSRYLLLRIFLGKNIFPELYLAPRGLISILLFFSIPDRYSVPGFESGTLLFVIITTSIIVAISLVVFQQKQRRIEKEQQEPK